MCACSLSFTVLIVLKLFFNDDFDFELSKTENQNNHVIHTFPKRKLFVDAENLPLRLSIKNIKNGKRVCDFVCWFVCFGTGADFFTL